MPLKEFWYADPRLLISYKKEYLRNTSYNAWLQGRYNFEAYSIVLRNAFAKKGTTPVDYPDWKDPVEKLEKLYTKKEKYEIVQHRQEMWFYNMLQS